jgi:oligo-1,6-glucosidase
VQINADRESTQDDSVLNYYKKMIQVRHKTPALVYGAYHDLNPQDNAVYAYTRTMGNERYLIIVNFKEQPVRYDLPTSDSIEQVIIETNQQKATAKHSTSLALSPGRLASISCNNLG